MDKGSMPASSKHMVVSMKINTAREQGKDQRGPENETKDVKERGGGQEIRQGGGWSLGQMR